MGIGQSALARPQSQAEPDQLSTVAGPPASKLEYRASLDGLRAPAVLLVMTYHLGFTTGGYVGVDLFFVLSGFLITTLLLREYQSARSISIAGFYARRVRRLLPALVLVCAFVGVVFGLTNSATDRADTLLGIPLAAGYASAWVSGFDSHFQGFMSHAWSLSVEEWFYLVWPVGLLAILRRRPARVLQAVGVVLVVAVAYRTLAGALDWPSNRLYYTPDMRAEQLLGGCFLAVLFESTSWRPTRNMVTTAVVAMAIAVLGFYVTSVASADPLYLKGGGTVVWVCSAIVIAWVYQWPHSLLSKLLATRPLVWTGRRAYGLYLWHIPLIGVLDPRVSTRLLPSVAVVAATFGAAALSYRYLELPVMQRGRSRPAPGVAPVE